MAKYNPLTVKNIHRETDKCVTLHFEVPEALKKDYAFKAGQYITLKVIINGEEVRRDYSLCSSPNSDELKVAVKEVNNGTFSKYANKELQVGDRIEVSLANGRFTFEPDATKTRTIAAFAAGSGITPILSIVKTVLEEEPNSQFILVYGNKTIKDTIFLKELLALQNKYNDRFYIQFLYSQAREENALFGRIEKSTVNLIIKNKYKHTTIDAFYICGPEVMINTVKAVLIENNIPEEHIYFELFTASVTNDTNSSVNTALTNTNGLTKVTVIIDEEEEEYEMSQKQTILEAAIDKDIDPPYSCQGGVCSSCVARVIEGTAVMRQNNILTDSEVADGLVLTCQALPTSASIKVDYDDV